MSRVFEWVLKLVEMRRDRSVSQARRARQDYARSREFTEQLNQYAAEYDKQWSQVAQAGESVLQLRTSSAFGENLRGTARAQGQETDKLREHSQKMLDKALQDSRRVEAIEQYMAKQRAQRRAAREHRETKDLEDDLNARRARR